MYHKELNECLFQPKLIAKKKPEPYNDAGGDEEINQPRFSTLYEDAKKRQERQAKLAEAMLDNQCTFKPDTSATKQKNERLVQKNEVNLAGEAR